MKRLMAEWNEITALLQLQYSVVLYIYPWKPIIYSLESYFNSKWSPPTCVWDGQPAPQEVEGSIGGVGHVAGQRFEVALSGQPAHKLSGVRVELAVVQSVRAVWQGVKQGPVGHGEFAGGVVARAQGPLVTGGGSG